MSTTTWDAGDNWVKRKTDGVLLQQLPSGDWIINPSAINRPVVTLCPCCDKPMRTPSAAMRVADHVYPPQATPP